MNRSKRRSRALTTGEAEELARRFHDTYERLAPGFDYETRLDSRVPWEDVPANNKALMISVVMELFSISQGGNYIAFKEGAIYGARVPDVRREK